MQNRSCESEFYLHETENTFPYQEGDKGKGGGGRVFLSRVHEQQCCVSRITKQIVYLISTTCLGDFCAAINSLGKPAVGGSERTGAKLHQKDSKVKLHQAAKC